MAGNYVNVGAAWWKDQKSKPGTRFLSAKCKTKDGTDVFLNIFPNDRKKSANQPDFTLSLTQELADALNLEPQVNRSENQSGNRAYPKSQPRGNYQENYEKPATPAAPATGSEAPRKKRAF